MNWLEIFDYHDGNLYKKDGSLAGTPHSTGYIQITVNNRLYLAHRIIWEMHNGPIPHDKILDHKNRIRTDNNITNLRLVTYSQNQRNRSKNKNNTSGYSGVYWDAARKLWVAEIKINKKTLHKTRFSDLNDAISFRKSLEELYGFYV